MFDAAVGEVNHKRESKGSRYSFTVERASLTGNICKVKNDFGFRWTDAVRTALLYAY